MRPQRWRTVEPKTGPTPYVGPQDPPRNRSGLTGGITEGDFGRVRDRAAAATEQPLEERQYNDGYEEYKRRERIEREQAAAKRQADLFAQAKRDAEAKAAKIAAEAAAAEERRLADARGRLAAFEAKEAAVNAMFIVSGATPEERYAIETHAEKKGFGLDAVRMQALLQAYRWNGGVLED
jgi:hypothetical protein